MAWWIESSAYLVHPFNGALNYIPYQPRLIAELVRGETTTRTLLRSGTMSPRTMVTAAGPDVEGFSDLLDAFLECTADAADTQVSKSLMGLWDAEGEAIKAYVDTLCPGDKAAAVNGWWTAWRRARSTA